MALERRLFSHIFDNEVKGGKIPSWQTKIQQCKANNIYLKWLLGQCDACTWYSHFQQEVPVQSQHRTSASQISCSAGNRITVYTVYTRTGRLDQLGIDANSADQKGDLQSSREIHGDFPTELFKKMDKNGVQLLRSPCSGGKLRKHPAVLEELHVEILTCDFIAVGKKSVCDSQAGGFLFLVAQLYNGNQSGNQI